MTPRRVFFDTEIHGDSSAGEYFTGDILTLLPMLKERYAGRVKCVYMDPPFRTGKPFEMRQRVGAAEWKSGKGTLVLPAFSDRQTPDEYYAMMRTVLEGCRELMRDDGMIFVHIDYRTHARMRLLMDEIFGEDNFLNEIVWAYSTGGRTKTHFSRKHDILLFYRKTEAYDFRIDEVAVPREDNRQNHMKRHIDADGRSYRSITVGGKTYTYYDDESVPPGDVWTDISHLQQRDPERTGYDTQKPLALLYRVIGCSTVPDDLVFDPFSGSGTTADAAIRMQRRILACDLSPLALATARRRLKDAPCRYHVPPSEGEPVIETRCEKGIGLYTILLDRFSVPEREFAGPLDAADSWAAGYEEDGAFRVYEQSARSRVQPELKDTLVLPVYGKAPIIRVSDVYGRDFYFESEVSE